MYTIRIIPKLDIKGPNLVKGIHLEGLRVLGKPERFARYYYESGADELLYMDVVASLYSRDSILEFIRRTSKEIFIPLTIGGGLRSIEDIQSVLKAGADKVAINTAAVQNPDLISKAVNKFGASTIVVSIEAIRQENGTYQAFCENGREETGLDAMEWAVRAAELGAGELFVTSVDREGTGNGYDKELISSIAEAVDIPVIACGGAGKLHHVFKVIEEGKADAVCAASLFHYNFLKQIDVEDDYSGEGNIEFIKAKRTFSKIKDASIEEVKEYLAGKDISCRINLNRAVNE